jgi:hypothetical protein
MTHVQRHVAFAWPPTVSRPPRPNELLAIENFENHILRCHECINCSRTFWKDHACTQGKYLAQQIADFIHIHHGIAYSSYQSESDVRIEIPTYCVGVRGFFNIPEKRHGRDMRLSGLERPRNGSPIGFRKRFPQEKNSNDARMMVQTAIYRRYRWWK